MVAGGKSDGGADDVGDGGGGSDGNECATVYIVGAVRAYATSLFNPFLRIAPVTEISHLLFSRLLFSNWSNQFAG